MNLIIFTIPSIVILISILFIFIFKRDWLKKQYKKILAILITGSVFISIPLFLDDNPLDDPVYQYEVCQFGGSVITNDPSAHDYEYEVCQFGGSVNVNDYTWGDWDPWWKIYQEQSADYSITVRSNGIDYFTWLGSNVSAYNVSLDIEPSLDDATEYIAIWNASTWDSTNGCWEIYYPSTDTGTNFTITTFMVIKINVDDSAGTTYINMTANDDMNYGSSRTYTWVNNSAMNKGYNYTSKNTPSDTTLSAINTSVTLQSGEAIAVWNEDIYVWQWWIPGFYEPDVTVERWDVIQSKVEDTEYWST